MTCMMLIGSMYVPLCIIVGLPHYSAMCHLLIGAHVHTLHLALRLPMQTLLVLPQNAPNTHHTISMQELLVAEKGALELHCTTSDSALQQSQQQLSELTQKHSAVQAELAESLEYQQQIEAQLNELELEAQAAKAGFEAEQEQSQKLSSQLTESQGELARVVNELTHTKTALNQTSELNKELQVRTFAYSACIHLWPAGLGEALLCSVDVYIICAEACNCANVLIVGLLHSTEDVHALGKTDYQVVSTLDRPCASHEQSAYPMNPCRMSCSVTQASINELDVVIDGSNVQISSLREQLSAAQQRLHTSEADRGTLQATVASLQQDLQAAQVRLWTYCPGKYNSNDEARNNQNHHNDDTGNRIIVYSIRYSLRSSQEPQSASCLKVLVLSKLSTCTEHVLLL